MAFLNGNDATMADTTHVRYKIEVGADNVPSTQKTQMRLWVPGPNGQYYQDFQYLFGFVQLQDMIDTSFVELSLEQANAPNSNLDVGVYTRQHPVPCKEYHPYVHDVNAAYIIQLCVFFGFALTVASTIRFQVWEKESHNFNVRRVLKDGLS